MKNILYIAYYYPPMQSGGTLRSEKFVKYLKRAGYRVFVLTATYGKTRMDGRAGTIRVKDISHNKNRRGLGKAKWFILRIWTETCQRCGHYHSIYHWWRQSVWRRRDEIMALAEPDIIIATYPPVETLEIGLRLHETFQVPLIADFRDGLLFESIEKRLLDRSKVVREHYTGLEKRAARESALVSTVSEPITNYFLEHYPGCHAKTIYTGFDPDDVSEVKPRPITAKDNIFQIVYTGRVSLSDSSSSLKSFVFAMQSLLRKRPETATRIRFRIAGEMSRKERKLLQPFVRMGVVTLCGLLNRKDALALQQEADLLLLITSTTRTSVVTTKVFEYLLAGRPFLALSKRNTAVAQIILDTRSGWIVHPENLEQIQARLEAILQNTDSMDAVNRDEARINRYSTKNQITRLDGQIKKILREPFSAQCSSAGHPGDHSAGSG